MNGLPVPTLAGCLLAAAVASFAAPAPDPPSLAPPRVAAAGRQRAVLRVAATGRYAIRVQSATGVALTLVDRMAGARERDGVPGERDGRIDPILDGGEYLVRTQGSERAPGEAELAVTPFVDPRAAEHRPLVDLEPQEDTLDDLEEKSWWLEVDRARPVALEAAGRNLADLRLWRDGSWLVDATPECAPSEPRTGEPLLACRIATRLEPGRYRVSAYGGPPRPWASGADRHPLYLRLGIPRLPAAWRGRLLVSPFGVDRFLVPGSPTLFRIELPDPRPARLEVGTFDPERPFSGTDSFAEIGKETVPPVAELEPGSSSDDRLLVVRAAASEPYLLQHFTPEEEPYLQGLEGRYLIQSLHAGPPGDSIDRTAVVVRRRPDGSWDKEPFQYSAVRLSSTRSWSRRFNLLGTTELFLRVEEQGSYEVRYAGETARASLSPFVYHSLEPPRGYRAPPLREGPSTWELDPGFYVLTLEPVTQGIVDMTIAMGTRPPGLPAPEVAPRSPAVCFPDLRLERHARYRVFQNLEAGVRQGVLARPLPADLSEPLPLALAAGEERSVPVRVTGGEAVVRATGEDGKAIPIRVDGGAAEESPRVPPGVHQLEVKNAGAEPLWLSVAATPVPRGPLEPAGPERAGEPGGLPAFAELRAARPLFVDIARGETRTFLVEAATPGLYRLESTGLLAIEGNLRTRAATSLARASQNGTGRNFLIQRFLRAGEYQLSVTALGSSTGRLGVNLSRTPLVEAGSLEPGSVARRSLEAGTAAAYDFEVPRPGDYAVRALLPGSTARGRLEDAEGWPLGPPGSDLDRTETLDPGRYRVVVEPAPRPTRVLTRVERREPEPERRGHGPHTLGPGDLGRPMAHTWLEPDSPEAGDAGRLPDRWRFSLAARASVSITLSGEMEGTLRSLAAGAGEAARVPPGRSWKGPLEAGGYEIEVRSVRRNNRAPYRIEVRPEELLAGSTREVTVPLTLPVSVGRESLVELASYGAGDVRARLLDASGHVVASSDDRLDDWNFLIARRLPPGPYGLEIAPVGARSVTTRVSMREVEERQEAPLRPPASLDLEPGEQVHVYPLEVEAGDGLLLVAEARAQESVALALEVEEPGGWRTLAGAADQGTAPRVAVPLAGSSGPGREARLRLSLGSVDRRGGPVHLGVAAFAPKPLSEADLQAGIALTELPGFQRGGAPTPGAARVRLKAPGALRLRDPVARLLAGSRAGVPLAPPVADLLLPTGSDLWLLGETGPDQAVRAARVHLGAHPESVWIPLTPGSHAVCDLAAPDRARREGLVLVRADAAAGMPAIRLAGGDAGPGGLDLPPLAVAGRSAVAVEAAARAAAAVVWRADDPASPADVRLTQLRYPQTQAEPLAPGALDGRIEGYAARDLELPPGPKRLALALAPHLVATLGDGDRIDTVLWQGDEPFAETLETRARRLRILHTARGSDGFRVEVLEGPPARGALTEGAPSETLHDRAGAFRLAVGPAGDPEAHTSRTLHLRGAVRGSLWRGTDGRALTGLDLPVGPGAGEVRIEHGQGLVLAWLGRGGEASLALAGAGGTGAAAARPLRLPAVVPLTGARQSYEIDAGGEALLHVRTTVPVVTELEREGGPPEVEVHPVAGSLHVLLPRGTARLAIRGLAGRPLAGDLEATASPIETAGDGIGPERILPAGSARAFAFELDRDAAIGIGVKADRGGVEGTLLDPTGRALATGAVQMPELARGRYLLLLRAPASGPPARVRPVLVGLAAPSADPPPEVIERYRRPPGPTEQEETAAAGEPAQRPAGEESGETEGSEEGLEEGGE